MYNMTPKIVAYLITENNHDNILPCLHVAQKFTKNIILINYGSQDNTAAMFKQHIHQMNILQDISNAALYHSYDWLIYFFPQEYLNNNAIDEMLYIINSEQSKKYTYFYHKLLTIGKKQSDGLINGLFYETINCLRPRTLSLRMLNLMMLDNNHKSQIMRNQIIFSQENKTRYIMNEIISCLRT